MVLQNLFDVWYKSFLALTFPSANDIDPDGFIGNVLEFIDPQAESQITEDIVPILLKFMPIFLFATKEASAAFEGLVKPLLENVDDNYNHEHYPYHVDNLVSLN